MAKMPPEQSPAPAHAAAGGEARLFGVAMFITLSGIWWGACLLIAGAYDLL